MVFPIVGGTQSTGYEISNSLRFNDDDGASMAITPSGAGNRKTWTYSGWVKRSSSNNSQDHIFMVNGGSADDTWVQLRFEDDDFTFSFYNQRALRTNRKFRDLSAWYHIVVAVDTTQATDSNRIKLYVNGVQETSFSVTNYPSQDSNTGANGTYRHFIGAEGGTSGNGSGNYYDGYMTEVHLVDGSQLLPTSFGEFDDNGVWVPIKYTGSYGTNGFFLQFKQTGTSQNSSGIGADTSGQDNHFSVNNLAALDVTEDTCTNNFATLNGVDHRVEDATLSEGNCKFVGSNGNDGASTSTIGVTSGKWYAEFKFLNDHKSRVGIIDQTGHDTNGNNVNDGVHYDFTGGYIYATLNGTGNDTGDNSTSGGYDVTDGSTNDILGVALDADNEKVLFTLNGTTLGQEGDGFTNLQRQNTGETFFFHVRDGSGSGDDEPQIVCNFGNPPPDFSISSGNTDGKYGNFEYAPPSGFYALCTKRLAEFG
jgi:hypothetical protein